MIQKPTLSLFFLQDRSWHNPDVQLGFERFGFDPITSFSLQGVTPELINSMKIAGNIQDFAIRWKIFVMADYCPRKPGWRKPTYPETVDNFRLYRMHDVYKFLKKHFADGRSAFPLLWTTNTGNAFLLLEQLRPDLIRSTQQSLDEGAIQMVAPYPAERELGYWCHYANVNLVKYKGRMAVCKIYKPGRDRYLYNRLIVDKKLSHIPEVLPILESGSNWILLPYLKDFITLKKHKKSAGLLPLGIVNQLNDVMRKINDAQLAHLDFHPDHVLINGKKEMFVIDFDRIHIYDKIIPVEENIMLTGYQNSMDYDGPIRPLSYKTDWLPLTGLSPEELKLNDLKKKFLRFKYILIRRGRDVKHRIGRIICRFY